MPLNRQIYLLDPHDLTPETIAVTFAKTSRSPQSFQEIADDLTDDQSAKFHEKWVVGYGHSSVAEHAILHIAVENVSRLAVECLESNRLASYTEKSTRYQKWDEDSFYIPEELDTQPILKEKYIRTNKILFQTYLKSLPIIRTEIAKSNPQKPEESEAAWDRRIRSDYIDVSRFLLPASSLANVGVTINARALEHAIQKMLSHPLLEVQKMGKEIKTVSQENVPTLVKYADAIPHWMNVANFFEKTSREINPISDNTDWCNLVHYDKHAHMVVLASLLVRYGNNTFEEAINYLEQLNLNEVDQLAKQLISEIRQFDIPVRELEYAPFVFELLMDQGAYFEIKRHRMMTQTPQPISTLNGYAVPQCVVDAGFADDYHMAMELANTTYLEIADWNPKVAGYVVPNAYNRRVIVNANLRSLNHLINLRSAQNAHFSVRRVAQRMAEEIGHVNPIFNHWIRRNSEETWQSIEQNYFSEVSRKLN